MDRPEKSSWFNLWNTTESIHQTAKCTGYLTFLPWEMNLCADLHPSLLNVCSVKILLYTRFQETGYFAGECSPLLGCMHILFVSSMMCLCVISVLSVRVWHGLCTMIRLNAPELDKIDMIKELLHVKFGHSVLCTLTVLTLTLLLNSCVRNSFLKLLFFYMYSLYDIP